MGIDWGGKCIEQEAVPVKKHGAKEEMRAREEKMLRNVKRKHKKHNMSLVASPHYETLGRRVPGAAPIGRSPRALTPYLKREMYPITCCLRGERGPT